MSLSGVYSVFYSKTISAQSFNNFKSQEHNYHIAGNATKKKKNLYLLLSTMILRWRKSFLVQRLSLRVWGGVLSWHVQLERTQKFKDKDRCRSTTKSTPTQADRHACTALSSRPGHKDIRTVTPGPVLPEMVHDRNNKT